MRLRCDEIQSLLVRVHEGEATPDQALDVARHLTDCTACRIARAREKRLAEMLSSDLEQLAVGEDFVDAVMATLPRELPKRQRRASAGKNWRGLKLAGFAGILGLLSLAGTPRGGGALALPTPVLPQFSADSAAVVRDGLPEMTRLALAAADLLLAGPALQAPAPAVLLGLVAGLALCGLCGLSVLAGASAVFATAAGAPAGGS